MKPNTRIQAASVRERRATSVVGIQDGVAGHYIAPRYIDVPTVDYTPGTKQYFESVARQLNKSVADYKRELKISHG